MRASAAILVLVACGRAEPSAPPDTSPGDTGVVDAPVDADLSGPTDTPRIPCTGTPAGVYAAQPRPNAPLGTILACAPDASVDEAALPALIGSDITVTSAVKEYRIAYQTRDHAGNPAVSTARAYLPSTPRARPVPIVVAMHGSVGLADACVPSANQDANLPLPYAARGFAVIAPDLAGLGNAGYQDYLDNRTQGWQTLDGARAVRALLPVGLTADDVILTGYSQGGGAALSAYSLLGSDGPGVGTVKATVVFAPEWPISMKSFDYEAILRDPTNLTIAEGLSYSSVAVMREFAFLEDHVGAGHGVEAVAANVRTGLQGAIDSQCLVALGGYIQVSMLHTGDLIEPTFRSQLLACEDGTSGCEGNGAAYHQFLTQNILSPDPHAGPVFIVAGLLDQIMPPAKESSCISDKLHGNGIDVSACVIDDATHSNIMDHHAKGLAWAESVLADQPRYTCASSQLPACAN